MPKDLHTYLEALEERAPGELLRVKRTVSPAAFEATAILEHLEDRGRTPTVLFESLVNLAGEMAPFRLVMNLFADYRKLAFMLGLPIDGKVEKAKVIQEYLRLRESSFEPEVIPRERAPVKEVIRGEAEVDLSILPLPRHNEMDVAPYMAPAVVAYDPLERRYNLSWNRFMYLDPRHTGLYMSPRHLWTMTRQAEERGENLPMAVVLGHHPAFLLMCAEMVGLDEDEITVAGGVLGEPVRLTPSETYGDALLVPADAEMVIEGEFVAGKRTVEAPYGEFTGYVGPQRLSWLFRARAMTHRRDAILHAIFAAHADNLYAHLPIEASLFNRVKGAVASVTRVSWLGHGPFNLIIAMNKRLEGEPMRAALAAIATSNLIKHVIVVDDDIDPSDNDQVMHAIATRVQAEDQVQILQGIQGHILDPSMKHEVRGSGMIIDATRPKDRPFAPRARVPAEVRKRVRLEDYLPEGG